MNTPAQRSLSRRALMRRSVKSASSHLQFQRDATDTLSRTRNDANMHGMKNYRTDIPVLSLLSFFPGPRPPFVLLRWGESSSNFSSSIGSGVVRHRPVIATDSQYSF